MKHLWEIVTDIIGKKTVIFFLLTAPLFFVAAFIDFSFVGGFSFVGVLIGLIYLARREWDYFTGKRTRPKKEEVHKVYIVYRKKKNWWDL